MISVEILRTGQESRSGQRLLTATEVGARKIGMKVQVTRRFQGGSNWLCLFGVGADYRNRCRHAQIKRGGRVACWDLGYLDRDNHLRVSIDYNHPWRDLDVTPNDPSRLNKLDGVEVIMGNVHWDPMGPVLVIGMGPKSREHLNIHDWEMVTLQKVAERFPDREILYRPKRPKEDKKIQWRTTSTENIYQVLRGASLVICRHSNVAVDACVVGIPVECEDGAAFWLYRHGAEPSLEKRLDFLARLCWWQWRFDEHGEAWKFLNQITKLQ